MIRLSVLTSLILASAFSCKDDTKKDSATTGQSTTSSQQAVFLSETQTSSMAQELQELQAEVDKLSEDMEKEIAKFEADINKALANAENDMLEDSKKFQAQARDQVAAALDGIKANATKEETLANARLRLSALLVAYQDRIAGKPKAVCPPSVNDLVGYGIDARHTVDPWGTKMVIDCTTKQVGSAGPDKSFGTNDDLSLALP